jgi:hypothetical protein
MQMARILCYCVLFPLNVYSFQGSLHPRLPQNRFSTCVDVKEDTQTPLPVYKQLTTQSISKLNVASLLQSYRLSHRQPLVDVRQIKDDSLRLILTGPEWGSLFQVPSTLPEAIQVFLNEATPRFIIAALAVATAARVALACGAASVGALGAICSPLGGTDAATCVAVAAFWAVQEWVLHDKALHSEASWFGKEIHSFHHDLPYYHLSLDGLDLAVTW